MRFDDKHHPDDGEEWKNNPFLPDDAMMEQIFDDINEVKDEFLRECEAMDAKITAVEGPIMPTMDGGNGFHRPGNLIHLLADRSVTFLDLERMGINLVKGLDKKDFAK